MKICSAARYQLRVYLSTSKPIMPFAATVLMLLVLYAFKPIPAADTFAASAVGLCYICAWIAVSATGEENAIPDQLIALKLNGVARQQVAHSLFLFWVGSFAAALTVVLPLILHAATGFTVYNHALSLGLIFEAVLLHIGTAFVGTSLGAFFCPRIAPGRKAALPMVCLVLLVGTIKFSLIQRWPFSAAFLWLFPPLSELSENLVNASVFPMGTFFYLVGACFLYGAALSALRIVLLKKLRFS